MKRSIKIMILLTLLLGVWPQRAYAEEEEKLHVDIKTYDGESVMIMKGHEFYSAVPVTFILPDENANNYYSISVDNGESFGGYAPAGGSVTLYPDDTTSPDARWQIRFRQSVNEEEYIESGIFKVSFDTTSPKIEFDDAQGEDGAGDSGKTARFTMSDDTGISRVITRFNDRVIKEVHQENDEQVMTYEFEIDLEKECRGSGKIDVECVDVAGNTAVLSVDHDPDMTAPGISAEGIENGAHMSCSGSLDIKAVDESGSAYISYTVNRKYKDELITTEASGICDGTGLSFDEDGIYTVSAFATDGSGNRSEEIHRYFTIDTTAPVVDIGGVYEKADIRSEANVTVDVSENIHEGSEVDIKLQRTTHEKTEEIPVESYNLVAERDVRVINIKSDGEYTLAVSAVDGAGNASMCQKRFRIDATPPDISISGLDEGDVTSEIPVLRFCAGEMFYGSTIMTALLEKKTGNGYVEVSKEEHVMRASRDHVDIIPDAEGEYRLTCTASDRSGNASASSVKFAIDRTPPVISGLGTIDNKSFKSFSLPSKLSKLVSDASAVVSHAYLDDTEIGEDENVIAEGKYVLTILAEDAAHNVSEDSAVFLVDHTSPQIVLSGFDREGNIQKGSIVKVSLLDEGDRLESVMFNDRNIAIDGDNTASIAVNDYGLYRLKIKASDDAGNVTDSEINTSCYMSIAPFTDLRKVERTISKTPDNTGPDIKGLVVGLATVLSGTLGLAYRGYNSAK